MSAAMKLSDFSLLKEDDHSYTVGHPKGRPLRLLKGGLSHKAQDAISKLKKTQNFDEGGTGQESDADGQELALNTESPRISENPGTFTEEDIKPFGTPTAAAPGIPASAEQAEMPTQESVPQPVAPEATPSIVPNNAGALETQKDTLEAQVKAEQEAAKASADALKEYQVSVNKLPDINQFMAAQKGRDAEFEKAMAMGKIDPNQFWTGPNGHSKLTAGIAMILGGIGSGLTGGPNVALQTINQAIERNIDAQKNDQSRTMNLWKMNREHTQDDIQATLATQNQLLSIAKTKMLQAQTAAGGAEAAGRLAGPIAAIGQQQAMIHWMQGMSSGAQPGEEGQFINQMKVMQQVRPDMWKDLQSKYVPNLGVSRTPLTEQNRAALAKYDQLDSQIQEARDFATVRGSSINPWSETSELGKSKRNTIIAEMNDLHGLSRAPGKEMLDLYKEQVPDPSQLRTDPAKSKLAEIQHALRRQKIAEMNALGIVPFAQQSSDQQALAFAQKYPNDPRSAQILQVLGARR